jgi:hypothetical protein
MEKSQIRAMRLRAVLHETRIFKGGREDNDDGVPVS